MIICLMILLSLGAISESTKKDYTNDIFRFICTDGDGFNEAKYQCYVQMYEQQKREPQSYNEIEPTITQESIHAQQISSDDGIMDSDWPMKCHDNKHTGRSPYSTINNNGAELWKFESYGWIPDGPVIDTDGTIYIGAGKLYALHPDGTEKWSYDTRGNIYSTPAIADDGAIYVGTFSNFFFSINHNGTLKWRFDAKGSIASSPAIADDGTVYFGTLGPEEKGRIYAMNPEGSEKWHYDTGYWITCDPAIGDDNTIYIGSGDTYFYALNPDGSLKWKYKTGHYIKGPASIDNNGIIFVGSYDGYLYAFYPNGDLKWKSSGHGTETNPSIGPDGTIYIGDDKLYAINPDDGSRKWAFDLGNNRHIHQSSPAVSADGIIYIGTNIGESSGGEIIAVNSDGTERWRHMIANQWVDSSPSIDENGIVYIGSSSDLDVGYLYAFGPGDVNNPPNKPSISGPNNGKSGESYSYVISATDPDIDDLSYYIEWGDGSNTDWIGPNPSGDEITVSHAWSFSGTYSIKVKAKDTDGSESNWATLEVTMPKSKTFPLLDRLIERWMFFRFFNLK
jgi:outer membrane protein assembly factor BamB